MPGIVSAAAQASYVSVDGCRTFLLRAGAGVPVLYLHGGAGGGEWLPFQERLAREFEVLAPEHPGYGKSEIPQWWDNVHDVAYFYLDFLEQLNLRNVHLIGSSIGGWIAAEIAVRSVERIKTLTLIGSAGIHLKGVPRPDTFMWTPEEAIRNLFFDARLADRALEQSKADDAIDRHLKNRFATARLAWAPRAYDPHLQKWLHRITIPTLIAWGKQDRLLPVVYAERFAQLISGSEVSVFDSCGHLPEVEQPEQFCTTFEGFTRRAAR